MTRLMRAIKRNDVSEVARLIEQGVDVDELDSGDPPLVQAAYRGYVEITRLLLEAGADVAAVDPNMKATALHAAAYAGRSEAAKLLIEYGVDVDKQGPYNGYTALHDAIWQNNVDTVAVILQARPTLSLKSHDGKTPLDFAKFRHATQIVSMLERQLV